MQPRQHAYFAHAERLFEEGNLDAADALCREMLKERKKDFAVLRLRGAIALRRGSAREALRHLEKCLALQPDDPYVQFLAGRAEMECGHHDRALIHFDEILRLRPGNPRASEWRAVVLELSGAHGRAREALRPFVEMGRESATMAEVQAKVDIHDGRAAQAVAILEKHLSRPGLAPEDSHRLGHLAGRAWESLGEHDRSFAAHARANRALAAPFDAQQYVRSIDALLETFSAANLRRLPRHPRPSDRHVFIAGMPRSGTTLIEQIIDAHPQACGVGEYRGIEEIVLRLTKETGSGRPYPECVLDLTAGDLVRLTSAYQGSLPKAAQSACRVVNKHLNNWRHLGLVALLFPAARVISCRRDPLDTGLSCYMSAILPPAHPWISDLANIGLVLRQYERLMKHWETVLEVPILEVRYEDLIDDPESHVRRIIEEFCGLAWDERCLRFHESGRVVQTLSYAQVRQPIYRSSIGRWRKYEPHLGPLVEALRTGSA